MTWLAQCSSFEPLQAVSEWSEGRLVVPPVDRGRPSGVLDGGRTGGERDHGSAPQQPNQAGQVVSTQSPVVRGRLVGDGGQSEQVPRSPTQRRGLLAPLREEAATVLDGPLPVGQLDVFGEAGLKMRKKRIKRIKPLAS